MTRAALIALAVVVVGLLALSLLPDRRPDLPDATIVLGDARVLLLPTADPEAVWTFAAPEARFDPDADSTELLGVEDGARTVNGVVDFTLRAERLVIDRRDDLITERLEAHLVADGWDVLMEGRERAQRARAPGPRALRGAARRDHRRRHRRQRLPGHAHQLRLHRLQRRRPRHGGHVGLRHRRAPPGRPRRPRRSPVPRSRPLPRARRPFVAAALLAALLLAAALAQGDAPAPVPERRLITIDSSGGTQSGNLRFGPIVYEHPEPEGSWRRSRRSRSADRAPSSARPRGVDRPVARAPRGDLRWRRDRHPRPPHRHGRVACATPRRPAWACSPAATPK